MDTTEWDKYGTGNYEKCADCMVHCGFEATAVKDAVKAPWKMLTLAVKGIRTQGPTAPDISLANQRPADFVFSRHVQAKMEEIDTFEKTTGKSFSKVANDRVKPMEAAE